MTESLHIRGREVGSKELEQIRGWLGLHPQWSRWRLSQELARQWDWRTATGQLKDIAARDLLNRLEARGLIGLPARQRRGGRQIPRALGHRAQGTLSLVARVSAEQRPLSELLPLAWHQAQAGQPQRGLVARHLSEHHYLGYPDGLGQIHYLVQDCHGQDVACLLFGPAAWKVAARDEFIGWSSSQRQSRLSHLANNSRFLILPWIQTPHLASHLLAQAVRRLRLDWPARHGLPLWLVETFVETERFSGVCYRAANWIKVGQTQGRTRNDRQHSRKAPRKGRLPPAAEPSVPATVVRATDAMSTIERLQQLEQLGEPGQWAVQHIVQVTLENVQLKKQLEQGQAHLQQLEAQVQELQRQAHRQAAPFRRAEAQRNPHPARPGRKAGHPGHYRPRPDEIDEQIRVNLECCPHCQGPVGEKHSLTQYIEELPVVRPRVTELITEEGWCERCQCEVYSTHPLQVSRAGGAAGVQLGARALALACDLNKAKGLSMRKTVAVLGDHFGLKLTAGGLALLLQRVARKVQPEYDQMVVQLRQSTVVHADETSWWVGGPGWWLWVFTTQTMTGQCGDADHGR